MRRRAPRPAAQALRAAVDAAAPKTPLAAAQSVWAETVGEHLAAHAEPVRERDGELLVNCSSATWSDELNLMQNDLLKRLRERLGEAAPSAIRFVCAPPG